MLWVYNQSYNITYSFHLSYFLSYPIFRKSTNSAHLINATTFTKWLDVTSLSEISAQTFINYSFTYTIVVDFNIQSFRLCYIQINLLTYSELQTIQGIQHGVWTASRSWSQFFRYDFSFNLHIERVFWPYVTLVL